MRDIVIGAQAQPLFIRSNGSVGISSFSSLVERRERAITRLAFLIGLLLLLTQRLGFLLELLGLFFQLRYFGSLLFKFGVVEEAARGQKKEAKGRKGEKAKKEVKDFSHPALVGGVREQTPIGQTDAEFYC